MKRKPKLLFSLIHHRIRFEVNWFQPHSSIIHLNTVNHFHFETQLNFLNENSHNFNGFPFVDTMANWFIPTTSEVNSMFAVRTNKSIEYR